MMNYRCRLCRQCKTLKETNDSWLHIATQLLQFNIPTAHRSHFATLFCVNILVHQALDLVHIRPSHNRNCHCQKAAQYVWEPKSDGERCGKKDVWSNLHVYENIFWHDGRSWVTVWKIAMKRKEWLTSWQLTQCFSWSGDTVEAIPMPSSEKWFGSLSKAAKMCKTGMATNNVSEKSL